MYTCAEQLPCDNLSCPNICPHTQVVVQLHLSWREVTWWICCSLYSSITWKSLCHIYNMFQVEMSRIDGTADIYLSRLINLVFIRDWKLHQIKSVALFSRDLYFCFLFKKVAICTIALFNEFTFNCKYQTIKWINYSIHVYFEHWKVFLNFSVLFGLQTKNFSRIK